MASKICSSMTDCWRKNLDIYNFMDLFECKQNITKEVLSNFEWQITADFESN